jgi:hypothetical protein
MREGLTTFTQTQLGADDPIVIISASFLDAGRRQLPTLHPIDRELEVADFISPKTAAGSPSVYAVRMSTLESFGTFIDDTALMDGQPIENTIGDRKLITSGDLADILCQIYDKAVLLECRDDWQAALDEMTVEPDADAPGM